MKSRILMSMLVIALAAALVGGATMAWFTDTATVTANTFTAGTLRVAAGAQTYTVGIGNMAPGDTITGSFVVTNAGSLNLKYMTTAITGGDLFGGDTPAVVAFVSGDTGNPLAPGAYATVTYTVTLPTTAGNCYQGVSGYLSFTVDATQTANPGWIQ